MEHEERRAYPLVDTHAHLTWPALETGPVLERARAAGVERMLCVSTDLASAEQATRLAAEEPEVYAAVGVHPNDLAGAIDVARLRSLARRAKVVAIGETGLDYYRKTTTPAAQREALERHLDLAAELQLPIIMHNREADADLTTMVRGAPQVRGVLHCFGGDLDLAEAALALGYYISFAGNLTYPSATALREAAARAPIDRLLVETDTPFLAPVPQRGKRNEPAFVGHTLDALARCRGMDAASLAPIVVANAAHLFGW